MRTSARLLQLIAMARHSSPKCTRHSRIIRLGDTNAASTLDECTSTIDAGGTVALATDTIYGVASSLTAVHRLYEVKRRSERKPVAIAVGDVDDVHRWKGGSTRSASVLPL